MQKLLVVGLIWLGVSACADTAEWKSMNGTQITAALTGHKVQYDTAWQDFRATGRTLYNAGRDSWGYWRVTNDQYCSMWPPQDLWACYDMTRQGNRLRFIGQGGDITEGTYRDR